MAATNYTSRNILWSAITALADGDLVTMTLLYNEGLQRLHDGQGALLGRIARVYSDLVSEAVGTKARIVGNVNMTTFNYDSGVVLNGLTVIVDENTTTAQTCTFTNAVTGPDVLLSQLTAACGTNLIWSLNDSGQLVSECQTIGGSSTIALGAGTAHSTIWPSPTITTPGAGTASDGASRIGVGTIGTISAGTLRAVLTSIESSIAGIPASVAAKVAKAGDTMSGALIMGAGGTVSSGQTFTVDSATIAGAKTVTGNTVFSGSSNTTISAGRKTFNRVRVTLSDATQTVDVGDGDRFNLPVSPASPRVITLDHTGTTPLGGETMTFFWNPGTTAIGAGAQYTFRREDASVIATFNGGQIADTGAVYAEFEYVFGVGWKLGTHSGTPNEYVGPTPGPESWDLYGVIPGASA